MEFSLTMTFLNSAGDKVSLTISDVKETLTQNDVTALMDAIIANDIFISKGNGLISKYGAQLTKRQTTKFEVK